MKAVGTAELKSRLSKYLRDVRRGETVTVLDRSTPVARIMPFEPAADVVITPPDQGAPRIGRITLPSRTPGLPDIVAILLEQRRNDR